MARSASSAQGELLRVCVQVLKQVHPDTGILSKAMGIMNSFVKDIFEHITGEASRLACYNKRSAPMLIGAQPATGEEWRNSSKKNEEAELQQKEYPVMDVVMEVKSDTAKNNIL